MEKVKNFLEHSFLIIFPLPVVLAAVVYCAFMAEMYQGDIHLFLVVHSVRSCQWFETSCVKSTVLCKCHSSAGVSSGPSGPLIGLVSATGVIDDINHPLFHAGPMEVLHIVLPRPSREGCWTC